MAKRCDGLDETSHAGRPRPWPHCVRWGPRSPSRKGAQSPIFGPYLAQWIKTLLGRKVGLDPSDSMLDGNPAPPPKRGQSPQFWAHVYCGQTAAWIKTAHDREVGLVPGHIELDGYTLPPKKGGRSPIPNFRPVSIVAKRLH